MPSRNPLRAFMVLWWTSAIPWTRFAPVCLCLALCLPLVAVASGVETRLVTIFESRQISVSFPLDWRFKESRDPNTGVQTIQVTDPKNEIQLDISFIPDSEGRLATREGLEAEMRRVFAFYSEGSVEREMKFTSFAAAGGLAEYTFFTDRSLVGRRIPEGERLISTTGMRSWKGAYLVFTLLSNSRDTDAYRRALEIVGPGLKEVRGGVTAAPAAPRPNTFTVPDCPWILTLRGEGLIVKGEKLKPGGNSGYFYLTNEKSDLNVSFFIQPAQECKSSRECRDMLQRAGFARMGKTENIRALEIGEVSAVECFVAELKGMPVKQQHLFAEFVVQGYWLDVHISKALYTEADRELLEKVVKSISFAPKEGAR